MKTFKFNNGEIRFENQIRDNNSFEISCILWNCFDKQTLKPLPYTVHETTKEEMGINQMRLNQIEIEYQEFCNDINKIALGNNNVANATNIKQFLNAYL